MARLKVILRKVSHSQVYFQILEQEGIDGHGNLWECKESEMEIHKGDFPHMSPHKIYLRGDNKAKDNRASLLDIEDPDKFIKDICFALKNYIRYLNEGNEGNEGEGVYVFE